MRNYEELCHLSLKDNKARQANLMVKRKIQFMFQNKDDANWAPKNLRIITLILTEEIQQKLGCFGSRCSRQG